jgi:hypothetical protein
MIDKSQGMSLLAATNQSLNPVDFPIGSAESRAAARAMLEHRNHSGFRLRITMVGHPHNDCGGRWCLERPCGLTTGAVFIAPDGEVEQRPRRGGCLTEMTEHEHT